MAIPLLAAIPLLGGAKNETLTWTMVLHAIGAIAIVIFGGRLVLRHLFRIVARTRMPEVFTATALLVVLGIAWFMQLAGLSAGLGAFLAGVRCPIPNSATSWNRRSTRSRACCWACSSSPSAWTSTWTRWWRSPS